MGGGGGVEGGTEQCVRTLFYVGVLILFDALSKKENGRKEGEERRKGGSGESRRAFFFIYIYMWKENRHAVTHFCDVNRVRARCLISVCFSKEGNFVRFDVGL